PTYLQDKNMELAGMEDGDGVMEEDVVEQLRSGKLHVRQQPGNGNALGRIKFVLPNTMNIYLHATPTPHLFARSRRDFSHGCVRVEQPVRLAHFVLGNQAQWTTEHIKEVVATEKTRRVNLTKPIPVVIFYATAFVNEHG